MAEIYENLDGGPVSEAKIVETKEIEEPLAVPDKFTTHLDNIRANMKEMQHISRALFFIEESQAVDSSEIRKLGISVSLNGAALIFSQPGLAAVAVEGLYENVDQFFKALQSLATSAKLVYFYEVFPTCAFSGFSVYRQSAASTSAAVSETSPVPELAAAVAKVFQGLMDVSAVGDRVSEEAANGLFPRNELVKVMLKSDVAMNITDWENMFGEEAELYTGDSDKLWPPLKI